MTMTVNTETTDPLMECPECDRELAADAVMCPTCAAGDFWEDLPVQTEDF